jgi:hypothetical protein
MGQKYAVERPPLKIAAVLQKICSHQLDPVPRRGRSQLTSSSDTLRLMADGSEGWQPLAEPIDPC